MARIKVGDKVAVDGLSNAAATAAIQEIGKDRLKLAREGNAKALREIKEIAAKWAKKHPCEPDCAPGAAPKAEAAPKSKTAQKAGSKPASKSELKTKAAKAEVSPPSKAAPSRATPKASPPSKAAPSRATPKAQAEASPPSKAAPSRATPKAQAGTSPPSKAAPKSSKAATKSKAAPKSGPKPKAKQAKAPKTKATKATNVTADKIKELRTKLAAELANLRVLCPEEKRKLVDDASAALATARAVALVSPVVRKARDDLQAALKEFAGYEAAKAALAAAEKSVPVQQAKAHVKAVLAEQLTANEQQIIEDAEKDPRVVAARKVLAEARTPEAVQKAQENLATARDTCRRSARTLRETYGNTIEKLRAEMAKDPPVVSDVPIVVPTAEELLFGTGPRTVASARAAS